MNIFNNIKIDKSKISYKKGLLSRDDRANINNAVKEYYGEIRPTQSYGDIYYEFNPNKQIIDGYSNINHNLQGMTESQQYEALSNITLCNEFLQKEVKYTRLDLCKDFLLESPTHDI